MNITALPIYYYQIGFSVIVLLLFFAGKFFVKKIITKRATKHKFSINRVYYIVRFLNFCLGVIIVTFWSLIWDISFNGLSIYFASIFTVVGVSFFAQWSILSNITASVLMFFNYSYKVGNRIEIMDGANTVSGVVANVSLFNFQIEVESGDLVTYPNNLIIQKPILKLSDKK